MNDICPDCGEPILEGQQFAISCAIERDAVKVHARCAKRSTAHGRLVERCPNCHQWRDKGETCFQCGVGPRIGVKRQ